MAGCWVEARSMSPKLSMAWRRATSRSKDGGMAWVSGLADETVKWLPQKCVRRSKNGRSVSAATSMRAFTAWT